MLMLKQILIPLLSLSLILSGCEGAPDNPDRSGALSDPGSSVSASSGPSGSESTSQAGSSAAGSEGSSSYVFPAPPGTPAVPGTDPAAAAGSASEPDPDTSTAAPDSSSSAGAETPDASAGDVSSQPDTPEPDPAKPLTGHIICIDPGHCVTPETRTNLQEQVSPLSNETKKAFGGGTAGKTMSEEKLNLTVGFQLRDKLQELGATVVMTREVSEITLTNRERCEIAYNSGSDVCVRIHADGSTNSSVNGVSVLIPAGDLLGTPSIVGESARLGQLMVDAVAQETGAKNRGTVDRSDLTGFNWSQIPTVLIEMGYMTNPQEDALLVTPEYQSKIVTGMARSLCAWYGAEYPG